MKKQILLVLMMFGSLSLFAVTLPTSSYTGFAASDSYNESYTLGIGTSFRNTAVLGTYEAGTCTGDNYDKNNLQQYDECNKCCLLKIQECARSGRSQSECESENLSCKNDCNGVSLPLGSSLLLLPFIAIYAVIRKRKEAVMA